MRWRVGIAHPSVCCIIWTAVVDKFGSLLFQDGRSRAAPQGGDFGSLGAAQGSDASNAFKSRC